MKYRREGAPGGLGLRVVGKMKKFVVQLGLLFLFTVSGNESACKYMVTIQEHAI